MQADYGDIILTKIENGNDLFALIEDDTTARGDPFDSRRVIANAFRDGDLYGLEVEETASMYNRSAWNDQIFIRNSLYRLPCFCIVDETEGVLLWVHPRARRLGLGSLLVEKLGITHVRQMLPGSEVFWGTCGVVLTENTQAEGSGHLHS